MPKHMPLWHLARISLGGCVAALVSITLGALAAHAQEAQQLHRAERARLELDVARAAHARTAQLAEAGLVSQLEIERTRIAMSLAEVSYREAIAGLAFAAQRIVVRDVSYVAASGSRNRVRVTVENIGGAVDSDTLARLAFPPVEIALRTSAPDSRTVIGTPLVHVVRTLPPGRAHSVDFLVEREHNLVEVAVRQGTHLETFLVPARAEGLAGSIELTAVQLRQEVPLGQAAVFEVRLRQFAAGDTTLDVRHLPSPLSASFSISDSTQPVSRVRLSAGETVPLRLTVHVPRDVTPLRLDTPIHFQAVASQPGERHDEKKATVALEVIPAGVAELDVAVNNLFARIQRGAAARIPVDIRNGGTRQASAVRVALGLPVGWPAPERGQVDLAPGQSSTQETVLTVPSDAQPGEYEVTFGAAGVSDGREIRSQERRLRVQVTDSRGSGPLATIMLAGLLAVGMLTWYGLRVAR